MTSSDTALPTPTRDGKPDSLAAPSDPTRHRARERRRTLARNVRHAVFALLILAAVIGVALALRSRPVPIDVGHATRGRVIVAIEESGMTRVKDRFVVSSPVTGSLSRLVLEPGDGWAVFRVDDGVARLTPVKIGHRGETEAEVVSGLPVGAAVAVHPGDRVKDGVKVEPR